MTNAPHTPAARAAERHTGPALTLSDEALAALKLPLTAWHNEIIDAQGDVVATVSGDMTSVGVDIELAYFIKDLLNAALLPAAPAPEPVSDAEWIERR